MTSFTTVLKYLVEPLGPGRPEVLSYRESFDDLWTLQRCSEASTMVLVFDGVPDPAGGSTQLNLADRLTAFDWIAYRAILGASEPLPLRVFLVDISGQLHATSFASQHLPQLLPDLPWVRLYKPLSKHDEDVESLLTIGDDVLRGWLVSQLGHSAFGIGRLLADLGIAGLSAALPFQNDCDKSQMKEVANRIRLQWRQALTSAHGRHEVSNLVAPLLMAEAMASRHHCGSAELLGRLEEARLTKALAQFLRALHLLSGPSTPVIGPTLPPLTKDSQYFASGNLDIFERFKRVSFLMVDDQFRLGYHHVVSTLLWGDPGDSQVPGRAWSRRGDAAHLRAVDSPEELLSALTQVSRIPTDSTGAASVWDAPRLIGKDRFDIVLLDLRLFPESTIEAASSEERNCLGYLLQLCHESGIRRVGDVFLNSALDAASRRVYGSGNEEPLAYALLPLVLSYVDPSLPIILFSSTHQRSIVASLQHRKNIVTVFSKPLLSGYGPRVSGEQSVTDLLWAIKQAFELHEKRIIWERLEAISDWRERRDRTTSHFPRYERPGWSRERNQPVTIFYNLPKSEAERISQDRGLPAHRCSDRPPRIRKGGLRIRLASDYQRYILASNYFDFLSVPFELLEQSLTPNYNAESVTSGKVSLRFEQDVDPLYNPVARAVALIRHKKVHGHARAGDAREWDEFESHGRMAILIFLFLLDFIEPQELVASSGHDDWDALCLSACWPLVHSSSSLFAYLGSSANNRLRPEVMTSNENIPWEDVTRFTLAVACRAMAGGAVIDSRLSTRALRRLIETSESCCGLVGTIRLIDAQALVFLSNSGQEVTPERVFGVELEGVGVCGLARSAGRFVALGPGCLPALTRRLDSVKWSGSTVEDQG